MYAEAVPKLWNETIETHRRTVRDAILQTAATLAAEHGLRSVTMSQIAADAGIGRATLYKYYPDVEAILLAWHERQIAHHLDYLTRVRDQEDDPGERIHAVLEAYCLISRETRSHHDTELAAFLHRDDNLAQARQRLHELIRDLLVDAAQAQAIRDDIPADELAAYCLAALGAAGSLPSEAAVRRLLTVTLTGLRLQGPNVGPAQPHTTAST